MHIIGSGGVCGFWVGWDGEGELQLATQAGAQAYDLTWWWKVAVPGVGCCNQ